MSKEDLGKIYKEKISKDGSRIYFSEVMSAMYLVVVESKEHEITFSHAYPFTKETKEKQRKIARNMFNTARYKLSNGTEIEED